MITDAEAAAGLTDIYRTPTGTMQLRPVQGAILLGAEIARGAFSNASVGSGKTCVAALAMTILGGSRPMILTEASNVPQMRADIEQYRLHWAMPTYYRIESYETISNRPEILDEFKPTLLVLDEAHRVKSGKPRWKRIDRWRQANPDSPMLCLSGSPGEEFADYAHLMVWAVPALRGDRGGPIAVDEGGRPAGSEFRKLCKLLKEDEAFHDKWWATVRATPGVVISAETFTETPLHITHTILPTPPEMETHWERLRTIGEAPDGWFLEGPAEQWGLARMMSGGAMYYEHIPRPSEPYRAARKAWYGFCQSVIDADTNVRGGPYDTEGQVARAVLAGVLPSDTYTAWMVQKPTYNPDTKNTWLSECALEFAEQWGRARAPLANSRSGGSIIWTEITGFGHELSRRTGWPYYGDGAKNAKKQHVRLADRAGTPPVIICSTDSCGTGKNLQHRFSRNLFLNPHSNHKQAEQNIGRTHRSGQLEPVVEVEYLYSCLEDWCAMLKAENACRGNQEDLTAQGKLLFAQHQRANFPTDDGFAWKKADKTVTVAIPE